MCSHSLECERICLIEFGKRSVEHQNEDGRNFFLVAAPAH